jgi:bidirectional [NiFe] hydrogenase diaphorase subunit
MGTACYVKGSGQIMTRLEQELGIQAGETTADGQMSLLAARCLGACGIAPAIVLDGEVAGRQTADAVVEHLKTLQ